MCVPRMPCYVCAMDARVRYSVSGGVGVGEEGGGKESYRKEEKLPCRALVVVTTTIAL